MKKLIFFTFMLSLLFSGCNPEKKLCKTWEIYNGLKLVTLSPDRTFQIKEYRSFTESGTWTYENKWLILESTTTDSMYFEILSKNEAIMSTGPEHEYWWRAREHNDSQSTNTSEKIQNDLINNHYQLESPIFEDQDITRDIEFLENEYCLFDNNISYTSKYEVFDFENNTFILLTNFFGETVCKVTKTTNDFIQCDCILYFNNLVFKAVFHKAEPLTPFIKKSDITGQWNSTDTVSFKYPDQNRNKLSVDLVKEYLKNEVYPAIPEDTIEIIEIEEPEIERSLAPPPAPDTSGTKEPFYNTPLLSIDADMFSLYFESKHYEGSWEISKSEKILILHDKTVNTDFYLYIFQQNNISYLYIELYSPVSDSGMASYILKRPED